MTNCPNCGAPYSIDNPVCAYCGTPREGVEDDFQRLGQRNIPGKNVNVLKTLSGRTYYSPPYGYVPDTPPERHFTGRDVNTGELQYTTRIDPSQQTACGAQALANAASHNTCSFEQMRLDAMQARFTAAEREQTARLMQNAFPYTPPPASVKRKEKRRFSPAEPFLFWTGVVCLVLCALLAMLPFTGNIQDWDVLPLGVKIFTDCFAASVCLAIAWGVWKSWKGPIW